MNRIKAHQESTANRPAFIKIPKTLFCVERYAGLTTDAKMLYGLLLDRLGISRMNGLADCAGRAIAYFTLDEVMARLHCARSKADELMDALRAAGLIETKRRGQGKANMVYVNDPVWP